MTSRISAAVTLSIVLIASSLGTLKSSGGLITVNHAGGSDFLTIQDGVDAATFGDTVLVSHGTYYEHVYVGPAADGIVLMSRAGADSTTIDGEYIYGESVVTCVDVGASTMIIGLTITRGEAHYWGGGIGADHADIRVLDCVVTDCRASRLCGGGIGANYSYIEVSGCRIEGNRGGEGGGIGLWEGGAIITGNEIVGNEAVSFTADESGGGIYVSCESAEIRGNTITGNSANIAGGGIHDWATGQLTISDNLIASNHAYSGGGGIGLRESRCHASNNVIVGNSAWGGAAIDIRSSLASPQFTANVCSGNTAGDNHSSIRIHSGGAPPVFTGNFLADDVLYQVRVADTPSLDTLDFSGDWWGTTDPTEIAARIHDCNDDPGLLWCIDFSNWCTDPSCSGQVTSVEEEPEGTTQATWGRIKSLYR